MKSALALVSCVLAVNSYSINFVEEAEIISQVNANKGATWQAGKSSAFGNRTLDDLRSMLGTFVHEKAPAPEFGSNGFFRPAHRDLVQRMPQRFDSRKKWPGCVQDIRDQQQCGSCYAFGATEVLADRFCIAGKDIGRLSPQFVISCDPNTNGCGGGSLPGAWDFLRDVGTVTDECQDYISGSGTEYQCVTDSCFNTDVDDTVFKAKNSYPVVTEEDVLFGTAVHAMKKEIFNNGPIEVGFDVYQDIYSYTGGIYHHVYGPKMGGHAVKIIGWGPGYWIIANSWGKKWGLDGFFRMRMGTNEGNIETNVWVGEPDL
eukprot:Awhi_evm1s15193